MVTRSWPLLGSTWSVPPLFLWYNIINSPSFVHHIPRFQFTHRRELQLLELRQQVGLLFPAFHTHRFSHASESQQEKTAAYPRRNLKTTTRSQYMKPPTYYLYGFKYFLRKYDWPPFASIPNTTWEGVWIHGVNLGFTWGLLGVYLGFTDLGFTWGLLGVYLRFTWAKSWYSETSGLCFVGYEWDPEMPPFWSCCLKHPTLIHHEPCRHSPHDVTAIYGIQGLPRIGCVCQRYGHFNWENYD